MVEGATVVKQLSRDPLADARVVRELASRYFLFDAFVSGRRRIEALPLVLSRELHTQAVTAAEAVTRALGNVGRLALRSDAERTHYRLPPEVERLAAASAQAGDDASLVRVDLLIGADGRFHACEVNADCPGGHNETVGLPELAREAGFREGENPTRVVDLAADRLVALSRSTAEPGAVALLYCTAYAEDLQVCAFLRRAIEKRGVKALLASAASLEWKDGALWSGSTRVTALYRYFPSEYMPGLPSVEPVIRAIAAGAVKTLSSFSEMYLQSKTVMARAWAMRSALDEGDREAISRHVPVTVEAQHLQKSDLLSDRHGWVLKRALGRVGDEVFVGALIDPDEWRPLVESVLESANDEGWIAQRFVKQSFLDTRWGERLVTLGAYVLDGRFAGYFARLTSESHCSHDALVVPVFTEVAS